MSKALLYLQNDVRASGDLLTSFIGRQNLPPLVLYYSISSSVERRTKYGFQRNQPKPHELPMHKSGTARFVKSWIWDSVVLVLKETESEVGAPLPCSGH